MPANWLFLDFDNTLMATEAHTLPSLIQRFNDLYGANIKAPLTPEIFKQNFHGQAREVLCANLSKFYSIPVDCAQLYENREWNMMRHYQSLPGGVAMAENLLEVLQQLAAQNWRFAFVSNNPIQRAMAAMRFASNGRGAELAQLLAPNFFEAGDIQKPKPDVYLRAIAQVGANPAASFAVEDSATGVTAATKAGLATFGYTGISDGDGLEQKLKAAGAIAVFNDWAQFPQLLQNKSAA